MTSIFARPQRTAALTFALLLIGAVVVTSRTSLATEQTRAERGWAGLRIAWPKPDARVRIGVGGDLDIAVYRPAGHAAKPAAAVLLIHGNRYGGSDAPLYRILARSLADRDAVVYSLSLPGFGLSGAFPEDEPVVAKRLLEATSVGIEYLRAQSPDPSVPRVLIGHSLGANVVLESCTEPDLAVEAIEPGRRIRERVVDPPHPELVDFTKKLRANVDGGVIDADRVRDLYAALDPKRPTAPTTSKRCDVIYSRLLPPKEMEEVTRIGLVQDAEIVWLENRGHDYGAVSLLGGVAYPDHLVGMLADTIMSRSRVSGMRNE